MIEEGGVGERFLPFFPTPSPLFYLRHFSRVPPSSFFAIFKPHGNACYAGYNLRKKSILSVNESSQQLTEKNLDSWDKDELLFVTGNDIRYFLSDAFLFPTN